MSDAAPPNAPARAAGLIDFHPMDQLRVDPSLTIVVRPPDLIQLGLADDAPLLQVTTPPGPDVMVDLLRWLQRPLRPRAIARRASFYGLSDQHVTVLLRALHTVGALRVTRPAPPLAVFVHGSGPLARALRTALNALTGVRVVNPAHHDLDAPSGTALALIADLVVLADALIAEPALVAEMMAARLPHMPVRVRDGLGIVGPLVLPGSSVCLTCLDRARTDCDPFWPTLAVQLSGRTGEADAGTIATTAALAAAQIERIVNVRGAQRFDPPGLTAIPQVVDCTVEIGLNPCQVTTRTWTRHPGCTCAR